MPPPTEVDCGGTRYALVRRRDVITPVDELTARRLVEQGLHGDGLRFARQLEDLAQQLGGGLDCDPVPIVIDGLVSGRLIAVRWGDPARLMSKPPPIEPLVPLDDPGRLPGVHPGSTTYIELEVLHETGGLFPGARFAVELPDGSIVDGILDSTSRWLHSGVVGSGSCSVQFYEPLSLSEGEQRHPSSTPCEPRAEDLTALVDVRAELELPTGRRRRLIVRLPPRTPVVGIDLGCFAAAEAFVTPAIAAAVDALGDALQDDPRLKLGALANADRATDPTQDKALSDRRARALVAILIADEEAFDRLAEDDAWGLRHDQAMLRGLGCNPAAIDGVDGPLTRRAVRWFQDEWSRGVHHPDGLDEPTELSGTLDDATRRALRRSYLLAMSPQLSQEQLIEPRALGCGSFVLPPSELGPARGGSFALWREPPRHPFPCRDDDPTACRLDDRDPSRRCRFHRETFDITVPELQPTFYDFEWLRLPSGSFNLSAVTSLPDGTRVRFHVMRDVQDYDGRVRHHHGPGTLPQRGVHVGHPVDGIVRYGICVALWSPHDDWDPLAWREWLTDLDPRDGSPVAEGARFHPPLFAIEYAGGWVFSRPPGERIDRFVLRNAKRSGLALTNDGSFVAFTTTDGSRVVSPRDRRADEHTQIVGWCSYEDELVEDEERP